MLFLVGPVAAALAAVGRAGLKPDFGPIETRNHYALALPFLRLDPRAAVLQPGARQLSVGLDAANDYRNMTSGNLTLLEKYEYERLLFRYRIGLKNDSDITFDVPLMDRSGGFLDPLIDIYHRLILQLRDNPRIGLPYGLSEIYVPGSHRFGSAAGIGDVSAEYTKGFGPRLMFSIGGKIPTGDRYRLLGSGNVDGAAQVEVRIPWGSRWKWDFTGGVVAQSPDPYLQSVRGLVHQESISLEHRANKNNNYILQWQGESAAVQTGISGADSTNRVLSIGWQHRFNSRQYWEAFWTDNGDWLNYRVPELVNVGIEFTCGIRLVSSF